MAILHGLDLVRLLYTSSNPRAADRTASQALLQDISLSAIHNNRRDGVTGCLVYAEGHFIQVLEGPSAAMKATFERICCDERHIDLQLLDFHSATERVFGDWHMTALSDLAGEGNHRRACPNDLGEIRFLIGVNANEAVLHMRNLLDRQLEDAA